MKIYIFALKKYLWLFIFTVIFFAEIHADEVKSLAVIGFINLGDKTENSINLVVCKSMTTFLSKLPGIKIRPFSDVENAAKEENFWESRKLDVNAALDIGLKLKVNQAIFGTYSVNKQNETIIITVYDYDVKTSELILKREYKGDAGRDIFDTVDKLIKNISSLILGKDIKIGKLNVEINAENREYKLYINNVFQKDIKKSEGFSDIIAANEDAEISLRNLKDGKENEVYKDFIRVKEDDIYKLSYTPSGSILIKTVPKAAIIVNDIPAGETGENGEINIKNIRSEFTNVIKINKDGKEIWEKEVLVEEGKSYQLIIEGGKEGIIKANIPKDESKNAIRPVQKEGGRKFYIPIRFFEGGLGGSIGVDYKFIDYFRVSASFGVVFNFERVVLTEDADISYSFFRSGDFRLWLSTGGFCYNANHFILSPILKLEMEWWKLFIDAGMRYSMMDGGIYPMIGIGVRF